MNENHHKAFFTSHREHILMITNHGLHQWQVIPGLPDTGGQNVFVNQMSDALARQGFRITIANRGGYPHPETNQSRTGIHYKDDQQRIVYMTDTHPGFIRKEDMKPHLPVLAGFLHRQLSVERIEVDLIISHYWDGAQLGILYNNLQHTPVKHIWVPHSLGTIKMKNVDPSRWEDLHIAERIVTEHRILSQINGIGSTSSRIQEALVRDYHYPSRTFFLPPCVDPQRFYPRDIPPDHKIWEFLQRHSSLTIQEIQRAQIITEVSRTDITKRKGLLISSFARVLEDHPQALLVITITESNQDLYRKLTELIDSLGVEERVIVLGSIWEELPVIYNLTDVYCTPSVMEGFGMSAQEAAASRTPVVASQLVPFAVDYLLGDRIDPCTCSKEHPPIKVGAGGIVVPTDSQGGLVCALNLLLEDKDKRLKMAQNAYQRTVPRFTWDRVVDRFLDKIGEKNDFRIIPRPSPGDRSGQRCDPVNHS